MRALIVNPLLLSITLVLLVPNLTQHVVAGMITATADTYITVHSSLDGPDSNHGGDDRMFLNRPGGFQSAPLLKFDLSSFSQVTVSDPVELQLTVIQTFQAGEATHDVTLHRVLVDWDENTVTWNNFGDSPGPVAGEDYEAASLDSKTIVVNPGDMVSFTLPAALIQDWIDNPTSNFGLLLLSESGQRDVHFGTRERSNTDEHPTLTFAEQLNPIPEPASLTLLGIGICGIAAFGIFRRRGW